MDYIYFYVIFLQIATIVDINAKSTLTGTIEIFDDYIECLDGISEFDYIWVLTYFHLNSGFKTKIKPQPNPNLEIELKQSQPPSEVGLFSSRAPHRPNPIGLSALKVVSVDGNKITVDGLDILEGYIF